MLELLKSDTFWSALSAIATLAGATGILLAARQLRFEAWLKAQEIWVHNDFTEARGKLFAHVENPPARWEGEDKALALRVCRRIDEFVRLAPYLGRRRMLAVWGDPLAKAWFLLEPLVRDERKAAGWSTKWDAFERLGKEALRAHPLLKGEV
jgi:hypothetical protein